jgi:hypothetical protein
MVAPNVRDIISVPGRLSFGPSNLTTAYPHGGTALGIVQDIAITLEQPTQYVLAEEYGNQKIEGIVSGEGCAIGAVLRSWDRDAITRVFKNTALGAVTGKRRVAASTQTDPSIGIRLSGRSIVLVFTPDDVERHPMFLMRRALPAIKETSEVAMRLDVELSLPVFFYGIRDTAGLLYDWGMARDITL